MSDMSRSFPSSDQQSDRSSFTFSGGAAGRDNTPPPPPPPPAPAPSAPGSHRPRHLSTSGDVRPESATHLDRVTAIPAGFCFPSFPRQLQCAVCRCPYRRPVIFHPCGHVACKRCTPSDDLSACPACQTPCAHFSTPPDELIAEARSIPVLCEYCSWQGPREAAARHTCHKRQFDAAQVLLSKNRANPKAWFMLGASMKAGQAPIVINGETVTKQDCYVRALEVDPGNAMAWGNLGACLDMSSAAIVGGLAYTKRACIAKCLHLNPELPLPWFNLGNVMQKGDTQDIGGLAVFKDTCYVRALTLDPRLHAAWHNLGLCLDRDMVIDIGEREYDASMCFITAILTKPDFAESWSKLAIVGAEDRTFLGRRWSPKECAAKALSINKALPEPWITLSRIMTKVDDTVHIGQRIYTTQHVQRKAAKAAQIVPQRPQAHQPARRSSSQSTRGSRDSSSRSESRATTPRGNHKDPNDGACTVM